MKDLNADYWEQRYRDGQTGWDVGYATPAICRYFEGPLDKQAEILIPGAGHAYEAAWLIEAGYKKVSVIDWSETALAEALEKNPVLSKARLLAEDFFRHQGQYDFIIEQTFFCAIEPRLRSNYAQKAKELLRPGAKLVGLLFNFPLTEDGPPYGGSESEYRDLFAPHFKIEHLALSPHSIKPRAGKEFFIELRA